MKEKFAVSLFSQFFSSLIHLFSYYILFLNLDVTSLGIWAYLNSLINLGFLFIDLGIDSIHFQYSGKKDFPEYFGTYFTIKNLIILANTIVAITLITFLGLWNSNFIFLILLLLFSKIIVQIIEIFLTNLKTRIKIFKAEIPFFIIKSFKSLAIIFIALNLSYFLEPIFYLCLSNFILDSIFIIIILILSKKEFRINKLRKNLFIDYFRDAKPLIIFSILLVIAGNLGNLIIKSSLGYESLGYVSLINNYILPMLIVISGGIVNIYFTLFSRYFEAKNFESITRLLYKIEKYSSIIFLSIIMIVFLNGNNLFIIFLPHYINSLPILYIMIFVPYLIGISQPHSYLFISAKKQKLNASINSFTRILIILLIIILIPNEFFFINSLGLGAIGYAISQTVPWIFWCILCHFYTYKCFKIIPNKKLILHIGLALLSYIIVFFCNNYIFIPLLENKILILIISSVMLLLIFNSFLIIFKELKRNDFKFILQLFNLKNYKESLLKEF